MTDQPNPPPDRSEPPGRGDEPIPLGQRLLDRPFLLLGACMVIMFVFFTGCGLWEIASLSEAPLP